MEMINLTIFRLNIQLDRLEEQKQHLETMMKSYPKNKLYPFTYQLLLEDEKKLEERIEKERDNDLPLL